ncbi:coniferyl aldehyde dehydrogenase [Vibrio panuliri]|uniref:Aldehyde dehydrogenase n=1 Tax=Vibrio panuliri TaxID=1381081 RepID=A0A1Q9HRV2_9VIBR|nr:coniferyl aldehyde dehydrogenase [Vibrio panuliri]KAB1458381.1 coniferyl aldehyde dehydrogenase [Vibrio panuliri]OLQ91064.1 coniferyl-aldehyde dehydrogenase [Vibrio panuliri]OLQ93583.1 coniferyl-aldehyde dehydrogenase [Vibrio panuliri]
MEKVVDLNRWQKAHVKSQQELQALFDEMGGLYQSEPYASLSNRLARLQKLKLALLRFQPQLVQALGEDFGYRSEFDSTICDLLPAVEHINYTVKHLRKWMKPKRRRAGLMLTPSKLEVVYQPLGVVGVIVPWNFPIFLSIGPIVTALAAGNRVMVKLSEHTPNTNQVLSQVLAELESYVFVVEGEVEIAEYFSQLPFDHLLFTGSTKVGKLVAEQAARNLTPVTLELGGKSPVIIAPDADLDKAVDAILMGKSINAGQICVAPDYVLLPEEKQQQFVDIYLRRFSQLFIETGQPLTQIINEAQFERLKSYIEDAREKGAQIHTLEQPVADGVMLPHLLTDLSEGMLVMKEEIFGPILPIVGYRHIHQVFEYIENKPRPLALYLMSNDSNLIEQVRTQTHSGGLAVNDTLLHVSAKDAPFGGIGQSGMGHYHGVEGFQTFSKAKTVLTTPSWLPRSRWLLERQIQFKQLLSKLFLR